MLQRASDIPKVWIFGTLMALLVLALWLLAFERNRSSTPDMAHGVSRIPAAEVANEATSPGREPLIASETSPPREETGSQLGTGRLDLMVTSSALDIPARDLVLWVERPGGAWTSRTFLPPTDEEGQTDALLAPGAWRLAADFLVGESFEILAGRTTSLVVQYESPCRIEGHVLGADGIPVPGAQVYVSRSAQLVQLIGAVRSAADGSFQVAAGGAACILGAVARGYLASPAYDVGESRGVVRGVEIVLPLGGETLSVRVVGWHSLPVPAALVEVTQRRAP